MAGTIDGMNGTSTVIHQINGAAVKALVPCPIFVKLYKHRMSGVDFIYQKLAAYGLKWKRKFKFYLKMSLKLTAIAIVNSDIVYKSLRILELRFVDLKIVVANLLIVVTLTVKDHFQEVIQEKEDCLSNQDLQKCLVNCPNNKKKEGAQYCKDEDKYIKKHFS